MEPISHEMNHQSQDWQRVDARILGQILAAQNLLFVLPDEARIAEFFAEALSRVPGVTSCFVCLGNHAAPAKAVSEVCRECMTSRKGEGDISKIPVNFSCGLAGRPDLRIISLSTTEHTFGYFIFQPDRSDKLEPYWPFLNNLANYVALSLENRLQKLLLEQARDELDDQVKKRTEELRQVNERFALATRAASLGVWDWDIKKNETVWDDRMYELYGVKREDFNGGYEAWLQALHPDDRASNDEILKRAQVDERLFDTEFRVVWPDKSVHYLKSYGQFVRDEAGSPVRMIGINFDITERKEAEQALRESEERLRQIASSLREVVWLRDTQTRQVLYVNPAFEKLTGRTCQSFYENRDIVVNTIHPDDKEGVIKALEQRPEGIPYDTEHRIIHLDGSVHWVSSRSFPVRNETGEAYRWASIMEDITERKRAEEEIRQLNQELERRVAKRTAQLEAANKELEAFAYSVSHDLRVPLRHIRGFLEMLENRIGASLDEPSRHYMTTIANSTKRMGQLIDDLLSFSRMGRNEMTQRSVDLAVLVQEVIRDLEPEAQGRAISWHVADLPTVTGDLSMLRLVLVNLLSNALKFTRQCSPADIEIGCLPSNDDETVFFVRDNGAGFDMDYADKLFGVFQRLHRADEFEGTGVGLANVRRIIHRHGGRTWAEGKVDRGATFYFSLPKFIQET